MPFPRILRLQDDKWNNPEDSIGTFIGYLRGGRYRCWEAAGPARQAFRELSPDIKDFLETSGIPPSDVVSWSIYMIGHNESNAAPKLLICSTDAKTRKNIRQLIKDSKIMDKYPGIGIGDVSALPDRPVIKELSREAIEALLPFGCDVDGAVVADGSEPALGKRIFIVNPNDFSLRPATTGPIILQDDRCYQLTVAHVFRHKRELDRLSSQQMAEDDCDFEGMSDDEGDEENQRDEITSKGSATSGEIDSDKASFEASLDAFSLDKHPSSSSEGLSSDHLDSGNDPPLSVEAPEENPGFGEIDVSQLQFFGRLVLSSLTGSNPSLDYALIETSRIPEDAQKSSTVTDSVVSNIGEIESDDIRIVAMLWPYCTVEGRLTATPSYIRLPGQRTFQEVYPIRLVKPLRDGDCGAAVYVKADNRFYGHIVAGGPGTSIAYVVLAGEISRDIQARSGFGLIWMPQQEGQQQHSENNLQRSTGSHPDSTASEVSSIRHLGTWEPEEPQGGWHLRSIEVQKKPNSQLSQSTFINSRPVPEHKTGYHYSGKNDEGKLADSQPPLDWSTIPGASSGPQTRRKNTGPTASLGQQFRWPRTITYASPASGKLPERQTSHSADSSKYLLPGRIRSGYMSHFLSHTSPATIHPAELTAGLSLEASVDTAQGVRRRTRNLSPSLSHSEPSSSGAQRDEVASCLIRISVLPREFEDACETCIFWLLSPEKFSSTEWQECRSRKEGISHIISHAIAHHGLIRGRDPQYPARKYLASCQSSDPFVNMKGDCVKCGSLSEWNEADFADFTHHGVVLCLRCWQRFDKKEMNEHLAGPLCDFSAEHPKAKKVWILYTAFCSETLMPSKPPESVAQQESPYQRYPRELRKRRQQELKPKGEISPYQKAAMERNTDYRSADGRYM
ncbi:hypothetical protein J7337_010025 [Fusarium musae]|uniref:Uncharacterized protein n=1 Tax=Fusarium musae TaxID=1042133 RepID=A0A9P8ILH9_9HYPO|nr:hypothetical protein J7337_010025 [Fusarium musae]KAG9499206.1 hypothetical protein J7337_010025 [Fusarium musae]